jgi:Tol biopolymer transport system component
MRTTPSARPPAAGAEPEVLIQEARRRQRRRYLVAGLATAVLAGVAGVAVGLAGPGGHSPVRQGLRHGTHRAASTSPVPAWAKQLTGEVAYMCGDSICLMRPDETGLHTLPATYPERLTGPEWDPSWSPDGRRLAFRGYYRLGDGAYDLYVVDANGCHVTRLTHRLNGTTSSWSPNGRQIVFSVPLGIYVVNADGTGLRRLLPSVSRYAYGADTPAWSVTNLIAYVRYLPSRDRTEIYTVNPNGSGNSPLIRGTASSRQPSWSPDGMAIAFVAITVPLQSAGVIEVASAGGTGRHRVSPPSWTSYSPTWTPDGRVVFLVKRNATTSAYIVNRDGSGLRLLYPHLRDALQITWGPTSLPRAGC